MGTYREFRCLESAYIVQNSKASDAVLGRFELLIKTASISCYQRLGIGQQPCISLTGGKYQSNENCCHSNLTETVGYKGFL